jgi:chemotaxis protein methyltransferase CheR
VLEKSKAGLYTQFEVQRGLPIQSLVKHFTQVGTMWQLNADTRALVQFRQFNLLQDFTHLGKFDVIFCRNVLIYFDQPTKSDIFGRLAHPGEPDGYMFLGAAETVIGLTDSYRVCPTRRGVYLPNDARSSPSIVPPMFGQSQLAASRGGK